MALAASRRDEEERPALIYRNDPEVAKATAAALRAAVVSAIAENTSVSNFRQLSFSPKAKYPTLESLLPLAEESGAGLSKLGPSQRRDLLEDRSARTEVEKADGAWPAVERAGGGRLTLEDLRQIFSDQVAPAQLEASTRGGYYRAWRMVVTWGVSHGEAHLLLPMSLETLQSLTVELLIAGSSVNTVKNVWCAIEDRHRMTGHVPPLARPMLFRRMVKALASVRGSPGRLIFPISAGHVQALLRMTGLTVNQTRWMLAICLGTVCCARVGELAGLQICNLAWGLDQAFGPEYAEGAGVRVRKRKSDTGRRGLCTRVPSGILLERLRRWIRDQGLEVSPLCTDKENPGARCPFCPPLFPKTPRTAAEPARSAQGYNLRLSITRQMVSSGVKICMTLLGTDPRHFSGISMRRGGISAAINAGVPEPILFLQSGHGSAIAGRRYMQPTDPTLLYATGRAVLGST